MEQTPDIITLNNINYNEAQRRNKSCIYLKHQEVSSDIILIRPRAVYN